ncbi:MAG TPA: ankyrin repeat domain-containing protein [Pyrinomonadaceae bacterium]|nr:ankyrin repeat domain-containing protein [Pyrinomonadaceae bacterium]
MKKKRYSQTIRVAKPCTEDWGQMTGSEQVRFCSHCAKSVNNISTMTERDALRLVRESNGNVCIRYLQHPQTGAPVFANQLMQITRGPRLAFGAMATTLSLSAFTYAQGGSILSKERVEKPVVVAQTLTLLPMLEVVGGKEIVKIPDNKSDLPAETTVIKTDDPRIQHSLIWGQVTDNAGALIPGATVALLDESKKQVMRVVAGVDGFYKLENVAFGSYKLSISARNFTSQLIDITVDEPTITENAQLTARRYEVMGAIAVAVRRVEYKNPLTPAVAQNDFAKVRELLARGEDVNRPEVDGATPIFKAVENNNLEMVRMLLNAGANATVVEYEKYTVLMMLDEDSPLEMVELLLKEGVDVNAFNEDGDTALIRAADSVKPEVLLALLRAGANINAQNNEGRSALMNAANDDKLENVRTLILNGADVNLRDNDGDNAWDYASEEAVEELLVSHGCVVDPEDLEDSQSSDEPVDPVEDTSDEP